MVRKASSSFSPLSSSSPLSSLPPPGEGAHLTTPSRGGGLWCQHCTFYHGNFPINSCFPTKDKEVEKVDQTEVPCPPGDGGGLPGGRGLAGEEAGY